MTTATLVVVGSPQRHVAGADDDRRARLNLRLRRAFLEGAEEDSRRRLGRGLTAEELERVLRRYPGDAWRDGDGHPWLTPPPREA